MIYVTTVITRIEKDSWQPTNLIIPASNSFPESIAPLDHRDKLRWKANAAVNSEIVSAFETVLLVVNNISTGVSSYSRNPDCCYTWRLSNFKEKVLVGWLCLFVVALHTNNI